MSNIQPNPPFQMNQKLEIWRSRGSGKRGYYLPVSQLNIKFQREIDQISKLSVTIKLTNLRLDAGAIHIGLGQGRAP